MTTAFVVTDIRGYAEELKIKDTGQFKVRQPELKTTAHKPIQQVPAKSLLL